MPNPFQIQPKIRPNLDPEFVPVALWHRAFQDTVDQVPDAAEIGIAVAQDHAVTALRRKILPHSGENADLNLRYVERLVKFLLWQKGGHTVLIAGSEEIASQLARIYSSTGERAFDADLMGDKVYGKRFTVRTVEWKEFPESREAKQLLGGHLDGCRIGFDLGGSDRKCAAVIDGEVVHSEEVVWDPYFQKDPSWHYREINDTLKRAAAKMPRVDAIGGSSAGVYVDNQVRVASLFRGVSAGEFKTRIRPLFIELRKEWGNIPFEVVNDGEVTALAGAMARNDGGVLGIAMGTSLAAGYVTLDGHLTSGLDELAFVPIDYRDGAPRDEWSGDLGVGAQYFSQQAVARLAPAAGLDFPSDMPFPEQLVRVQELMKEGDQRAARIYETIGTFFGYAVAEFAEFYELRHLLLLGRVLSGEGGTVIMDQAKTVLRSEFPELAESVNFVTPSEKEKRHGQAVAAASLPELQKPEGAQ